MKNNKDLNLHVILPGELREQLEHLARFFGSKRAAIIWAIRCGVNDLVSFEDDMKKLNESIEERIGLQEGEIL